jgi:tetratricopeptide (TPR) repeat protein
MSNTDPSPDLEEYWEYSDPAGSEERFRNTLGNIEGDYRLEILTQIARTYGLRGRFEEANQLLDEVEGQLEGAGIRPHTRYLLERGRVFNSGGETQVAQSLFLEAWETAQAAGEEGLAVDAAHMVAITSSGTLESVSWNRRGLELARRSEDPKAYALIPAMLNNSGWDLHEMGRFEEALPIFEEALAEWTARQKVDQILVARWAVARCLRSLGRYSEALYIQKSLEREHLAQDSVDGYVYEEIAEDLAALGEKEEAKLYFEKAFDELSKDEWLVTNEPDRLERLHSLAGGD